MAIYGFTFDFATIGFTIGPQCSESTGACKNILFKDCKFINGFIEPAGAGDNTRMLFFRYTMPAIAPSGPGGMPTFRYQNISLVNCDFDAQGMNDTYGVCQFQNVVGGFVLGCRFYNTANPKSAALFLYTHNDGIVVANCGFYNNGIQDIVVTQNVNVTIIGNEISNRIEVSDVRNCSIVGNRVKRIDIYDWDQPTHEGNFDSFTRGTKDFFIAYNNFNTLPIDPQSSILPAVPTTIHCSLRQNELNPPENIFIFGNTARIDRTFVLVSEIDNDGTGYAAQASHGQGSKEFGNSWKSHS